VRALRKGQISLFSITCDIRSITCDIRREARIVDGLSVSAPPPLCRGKQALRDGGYSRAIVFAINTEYGLAAAVWSETLSLALGIAPKLKCGGLGQWRQPVRCRCRIRRPQGIQLRQRGRAQGAYRLFEAAMARESEARAAGEFGRGLRRLHRPHGQDLPRASPVRARARHDPR
jgi:hypothetical protein